MFGNLNIICIITVKAANTDSAREFKNAKKLIEVAEYAPLDRIVLETDCPYLAPVPNRGKRNHSGNLPYVVEKLAEIKGVSKEEIIRETTKNARALYRITE